MCDRVVIIQNGQFVREYSLRTESTNDEMVTIQLEVNDIEYALEHVKGKVIKEKIEVEIIKEEIPDIVEKLVTAGVRVYQVTIKSKSLEEEFLALTEGAAV